MLKFHLTLHTKVSSIIPGFDKTESGSGSYSELDCDTRFDISLKHTIRLILILDKHLVHPFNVFDLSTCDYGHLCHYLHQKHEYD